MITIEDTFTQNFAPLSMRAPIPHPLNDLREQSPNRAHYAVHPSNTSPTFTLVANPTEES